MANEKDLASKFKSYFKALKKQDEKEKSYYQAMPFPNSDYIHYELCYHGEDKNWRIEFHVEGAWQALRDKLREIADSEEGKRNFSYSTWYSSTFLKSNRPVLTQEQVEEDAKKIQILVEPKLQELMLKNNSNPNTNTSTGIQNLMPLGDLLKLKLCIPAYQRPYCWKKENVIGLIEDIKKRNKDEQLHLGIIILKVNKDGNFEIIDGQQRLLTLTIFADKILKVKDTDNSLFTTPLPKQNITPDAIWCLQQALQSMTGYEKEDFDGILKNVVFSVVNLGKNESNDLAFRFFSHTNSAGMPLSDYDLLKTHHLRYLDKDERRAEKAANDWTLFFKEDCSQLIHKTLFRLRKWSVGEKFSIEADDPRIREVFNHFKVEIEPVEECNSWPCPIHFNSILDGGDEFFSYIFKYSEYYQEFKKQDSIEKLRKNFSGHSYGTLFEGMLPLCFLFYCKFGEHYLPEFAYCIAYRISELRNKTRVMRKYLTEETVFHECTVILERATLVGEVFARLLNPQKNYSISNMGETAKRYWEALRDYLKGMEDTKLLLPKEFHQSGKISQFLSKQENQK